MILVFGSNEKGIHGAGAARVALKDYGAVWGQGVGLAGNSYAIPTKDMNIQTLPLGKIKEYVDEFKEFAEQHPELTFQVTQIGCGLAGFRPQDIAPLFAFSPKNCLFDSAWGPYLERDAAFWGTY